MNDVQIVSSAGSVNQSFGSTSVNQGIESASSAVAAQARAMVEARYVMAMRNPRNWDQVRQDTLKECRRPSFARSKRAYYIKPIGDGVEGLGIGFVEAAFRHMRNVAIETSVIFEDDNREIHRITVTDIEANIPYQMEIRVSKTVERSRPMDDGTYISVRKNSRNKPVYTVIGNDDDILNKRGALLSKAIRTLGERIIPADLKDEAIEIIKEIRLNDAAKDPDRDRKILADLFIEIGVKATDLAEYLGHDLMTCTPKEIVNLRGIHGAISSGEATWAEVMDNKAQTGDTKKSEAKTESKSGAKEAYPQEKFEQNLPAWKKHVEAGKQTPEQIIATVSSKGTLTDAQKAEIRALATASEPMASPEALETIRNLADEMTIGEADIAKKFGITGLNDITAAMVPDVLAFIDNPMGE